VSLLCSLKGDPLSAVRVEVGHVAVNFVVPLQKGELLSAVCAEVSHVTTNFVVRDKKLLVIGISVLYHSREVYNSTCGRHQNDLNTTPKSVCSHNLYMTIMSTPSNSKAKKLHDEVVRNASETLFKKYKVVMNIMGNKVASIDEVYPDLLAYDVFSVKPFVSSDVPTIIAEVVVEDEITDELVAKWLPLKNLNVDRIFLILPENTRSAADDTLRELGPKFELRFFDDDLHIT
jgi:hypothetical protein